jgi:tetratricopeptide (TPR) repeat protein
MTSSESGRSAAARLAAAHAAAGLALRWNNPAAALAALGMADAALAVRSDSFDAANVELLHGRALRLAGDLAGACACAREAVALARGLRPGERERLLVQALCDGADFERERGRLAPGRPMIEEALGLARAHLGELDPDTASAWNSAGLWQRYRGELGAAHAAYAHALRAYTHLEDRPGQAAVLHNLASLEHLCSDAVAAEVTIRRAIALRAGGDPALTGDIGVLGTVLADLGRYEEAAQAHGWVRACLGPVPDPAEMAFLQANEAVLAHRRGDLGDAARRYDAALAATEQTFGPAHPQAGVVLANAAALAADRGQRAVAAALAGRAITVLAGTVSEQLPSLRLARSVLADAS